jgi:hypothetical protein
MKPALTAIRIEGALQLNEKEIAVLHEVFSYNLADIFIEHCSKRIPKADLEEVFKEMRSATGAIMNAATDAKSKCFKTY